MAGKLIDTNSAPSTRSELSLFEVPSTQVALESARWLNIPTSTPVMNTGPFDFHIVDSRAYLQLSRCYVSMRLQLKGEGDKLPDAALINYIGATFFSQAKLEINNQQLFNCTDYNYKAYLEAILNYSSDQKNGMLQGAGFFSDDDSSPDSANGAGFKARMLCAKNGIVDVIAPLHIDHFNTDRYLLPHMNVHIQLYRATDAFVLQSAAATPPVASVSVLSMSLMVRAVNVISSANLALEKTLLGCPAKYPYIRTRVKAIAVPGGRKDLPFATLFTDIVPKRIVIGLLAQDAYEGTITKSPFNFQPFSVQQISIEAAGHVYPAQPLQSDFDTNQYAQNFLMFYENIGAVSDNRQLAISYKQYKHGYSLFAFNLSASDGGGDFELVRSGSTQLHIKFDTKTPASGLQVIVYAEYDAMYQVDCYRNIHTDQEA